MKLSVLVPTYFRVVDLERCLEALKKQIRWADEVLVVRRDTDSDTEAFLAQYDLGNLPLRTLVVRETGVIAALNLGFDHFSGDIIAITDDDAAPHPDWLTKIEAHFLADGDLGGLGGKDWMYVQGQLQLPQMHPGATEQVGRLQWWGRTIGNHHVGTGTARRVEILKGVNMSYRRTAIESVRIDRRLRGTGAQVDNEMDLGFKLQRRGWKLVYDPRVAVDHYPSVRWDEDKRSQFNALAQSNMAHNETLVLMQHLPFVRRLVYLTWAIGIGTRRVPGILQILRFFPKERLLSVERGFASIRGRILGVMTHLSSAN
jgi:cellulose synthase/poly-beta-1,6-N-acetylglucosamine synthase-like glycosyltransferase